MTKTREFLPPYDVAGWIAKFKGTLSKVNPKIADWAKQYLRGHVEHSQSIIDHVQRIGDSGNITGILDVGAVPGHISAMLKCAGFSVQAVDIEPDRAKGVFDAMEIPCHQVNVEVEPLPFPDASFALVIFCEVLEHLRNHPLHALRELYRVLQQGGNLLLSTPHITPLMRWRFLWGEDFQDDLVTEFAKLESIGHMGHFRLYSRNEVINLLHHVGFQIIQTDIGGKLKTRDKRWDARLLRKLVPNQMRSQLYVWAKK